MATTMRAKFQINSVEQQLGGAEKLTLGAVCSKGFGPNGESEDNTYARYTPQGSLTLTVNNPSLLGQFKPGEKFYLDFTPAEG